MKVFCCKNQYPYGGGLVLVAANTKEEAYLTAAYDDKTSYLFDWCKESKFCIGCSTLNELASMKKNTNYTHVQFSLGYPKKDDESRRMTFELKGVEYREGREEWGAEKGKKYLVEVLGRRTTLDGTKLWDG